MTFLSLSRESKLLANCWRKTWACQYFSVSWDLHINLAVPAWAVSPKREVLTAHSFWLMHSSSYGSIKHVRKLILCFSCALSHSLLIHLGRVVEVYYVLQYLVFEGILGIFLLKVILVISFMSSTFYQNTKTLQHINVCLLIKSVQYQQNRL